MPHRFRFCRSAAMVAALAVTVTGCSFFNRLGTHLPVYDESARCQGNNFCFDGNSGTPPPPRDTAPAAPPPGAMMQRRPANAEPVSAPAAEGSQPPLTSPASPPAPAASAPASPAIPAPGGASENAPPLPILPHSADEAEHFPVGTSNGPAGFDAPPLPGQDQAAPDPKLKTLKPYEANPDWEKDQPENPVLDAAKANGW